MEQETVVDTEREDLFSGKFSTEAALHRMRKRLLDLSLKNGLLNYRFPKRRALRIIDTPINSLFERLYLDGKECPIIPVPDPNRSDYESVDGALRKPDVRKHAQSVGLNVEYELSDVTSRQPPTDIQSLHYREDLERILRDLDQFTRTSIEETGANILYLVLGYLSWREAESSEKDLLAPLIVVPVALKRTGVDPRGYFRYSLEYTGEDLTDNITLREKLRTEFNLELPLLDEEEDPKDYFARIDQLVKHKPGWAMHRFATLCLLSFGKLLMYLDLDKRRWPRVAPIHENPIVSSLFQGETDYQGETFAPEYDVDDGYDLPLIYDADSSQHSAVVDAHNGKNLVIEGPPGTGKSQTITNLIASVLTDGKTVLFVSDKLAALEVVKRRLDNAGLGAFCLEFHSHKTQKRKILDDIKFRMDHNFYPASGLDQKLADLNSLKKRLTDYVTFINSVSGNRLGLTVHEILWASDRYRNQLDKSSILATAELPFASSIESLSEYEESLEQLQRHLISSGCYGSSNPWWGYLPENLLFGDEATVEDILRGIEQCANELDNFINSAEQRLGIDLPKEEQSLRKLCTKLALRVFVPDEDLALDLLPELTLEESRTTLQRLKKTVRFIHETEPLLVSSFRDTDAVTDRNIGDVRTAYQTASKLNQHEAKASVLENRSAKILQISRHLKNSIELFTEYAKACSLQLTPTKSNFGLLTKILGIAKDAPLDLLDWRSDRFFEGGVKKRLQDGRESATKIHKKKSDLQQFST